MPDTTEDNRIIRFRLATFMIILASAISFTFTVTTVYNKFLFQEQLIQEGDKEFNDFKALIFKIVNEKDEKTNLRLDKITNRIITRINELEKPKSD